MDNRKIIACNLKKIRSSKNYSQVFVAKQTGVSQRTITRAETVGNISDKTLKRLCMFYKISLSELYNEFTQDNTATVDVIPNDVIINLIMKHSFISDIQTETIYRYNNLISDKCTMLREDVESLLKSVISIKKNYTLSDVISCCLAVNQYTINNIINAF